MADWKKVALAATIGSATTAGLGMALYLANKHLCRSHDHGHGHDHHGEAEQVISREDSFVAFQFFAQDDFPYDCNVKEYTNFSKRLADICIAHKMDGVPSRALDVGCGPGGVTFELSRGYDEVLGIDIGEEFLARCTELKTVGQCNYKVKLEGDITETKVARLDDNIDRSKVHFQQGDACSLDPNLGQFGCVLAAHLLSHLPDPKGFLEHCAHMVAPNGIVVIATAYAWFDVCTPKEKWIGGKVNEDGEEISAFEALKEIMQTHFDLVEDRDFPNVCPEVYRTYYWTVSHVTIWRRKSQ